MFTESCLNTQKCIWLNNMFFLVLAEGTCRAHNAEGRTWCVNDCDAAVIEDCCLSVAVGGH